jgi:hypothetical protein
MRKSTLLPALGLLAVVVGCSSDNYSGSTTQPPPPPPPPTPTLAGTWTGTQTVTQINPATQCVSYNYAQTRLNRQENVTAVFTVDGTTVQLTWTFPFGTCTGTGSLSGANFDVQISQCTPVEHSMQCRQDGNGALKTRFASFSSMRIQGTADAAFANITGTVNHRESTRGTGGANTDPVSTVASLQLHK